MDYTFTIHSRVYELVTEEYCQHCGAQAIFQEVESTDGHMLHNLCVVCDTGWFSSAPHKINCDDRTFRELVNRRK